MTGQTTTTRVFIPYLAGMSGKSESEQDALERRIDTLPTALRDFLFDPALPEKLSALVSTTGLQPQYAVALSKIVFLATLGDIPLTSPQQLLEKLGIDATTASRVAHGLEKILEPLVAARARGSIGAMQRLPPLTTRIPSVLPSSTPPVPEKNVVDLRNKPQA